MRRRVVCCVVAVMALALFVVGCTAPEPASSSHTTKVPRTTPSQTPLTEDELYERAKQMYQEIHGLTNRLEDDGGSETLPSSFAQYVTGQYEDELVTHFITWKTKGYTTLRGDTELVWIKKHTKSRNGSVVAVQACLDASATGVRDKDGVVKVGGVVSEQVYFKYFEGNLKGFEITSTRRQSC